MGNAARRELDHPGDPTARGTLPSTPSEDLTLIARKIGRTDGLSRDLS
jgi:hypothetical protein